ncbi:MAG TPA: glutathione S-transferase, partial [Allocoleopsis sp.]
LYKPESKTEIKKYSPSGKVPVLIDGEIKIWDSLAINEYLAETYDSTLWPKDAKIRAIARSISAEMHSGFLNVRTQLSMDMKNHYPQTEIKPEVQTEIERIINIWTECKENYGQDGDFLFGKFTIPDAMFAPVVSRFLTYNVNLTGLAKTYAETIWNLPHLQTWFTDAKNETEVI